MDQYVKVTCSKQCEVRVDGEPMGITNEVFQIETGHHVFDLGEEACKPSNRAVNVTGTLPTQPLIIVFELA